MTIEECVARIRSEAEKAGLTPEEYADQLSRATPTTIGSALERLPTDVLDWAVKFEALSHPGKLD